MTGTSLNIASTVDFRARWSPGTIALSAEATDLNWAEVEETTARVGACLRDLGVEIGERVGVLAGNSAEWCLVVIAALRIGAVVVPLNPRLPTSDISYLADHVALRAVAVDAAAERAHRAVLAARPGLATISLDDSSAADVTMSQARQAGRIATVSLQQGHPALISFTSGTSGRPKGVTLTHDNIRAMAETFSRFDDWNSGTISLCYTSLSFNGSVTNTFLGTLIVGGRLIVEAFEPSLALQRIGRDRVTSLTGVPLAYEAIADLPDFAVTDLSSVRTAITGGAPASETLLRRWAAKGVRLRQAYGLTEATGAVTMVPPEQYASKAATVGIRGPWNDVKVVDAKGCDVGPGEVGEVIVAGPQVMSGYWADPAATAEAIRDGWLYTGDLGVLDDDGYLSLVGRKKDLIISGGINISPAEVERVVAGYPGVSECAAFAIPHERWGETVAVLVRGAVDPELLYRHARGQLANFAVPRYIGITPLVLPRNSAGKLLRRAAAAGFDVRTAFRTPAT
jgi:fatty-acyl-CoA synthase